MDSQEDSLEDSLVDSLQDNLEDSLDISSMMRSFIREDTSVLLSCAPVSHWLSAPQSPRQQLFLRSTIAMVIGIVESLTDMLVPAGSWLVPGWFSALNDLMTSPRRIS